MTIFERVKAVADKQGLSLQSVAQKAGFGINSIYGWKKKDPSVSRVEKVAKVLGVTTDYLLGNEDHIQTKDVDLKKDPVVLSYGGKPVSDEDMEIIKAILERHSNDKK